MPELLTDNTVTLSRDAFGYTVRCADRYENHLDPGEALFVLASLLLNAPRVPYLRTAAQHLAHDAALGVGPVPARVLPGDGELRGDRPGGMMDKRINRDALAKRMPVTWMTLSEIQAKLEVPKELYSDLCDAVAELVFSGRADHVRRIAGLYEWSEFRRKS